MRQRLHPPRSSSCPSFCAVGFPIQTAPIFSENPIELILRACVTDATVHAKPLCRDCFCRYHCCGGCHVHHPANARPGEFDAQCIQSRLVALLTLLRRMGHDDLTEHWLASPEALRSTVDRPSDRPQPAQLEA